MTRPEGYNDRLRGYIEAAIYDQAPTWESLFDSGPGQVVSVSDAALVAAMAASRFRLLYEQDRSRCHDCGDPADVCFCQEPPRRRKPLRLDKPRTQADDDRAAGRKWYRP